MHRPRTSGATMVPVRDPVSYGAAGGMEAPCGAQTGALAGSAPDPSMLHALELQGACARLQIQERGVRGKHVTPFRSSPVATQLVCQAAWYGRERPTTRRLGNRALPGRTDSGSPPDASVPDMAWLPGMAKVAHHQVPGATELHLAEPIRSTTRCLSLCHGMAFSSEVTHWYVQLSDLATDGPASNSMTAERRLAKPKLAYPHSVQYQLWAGSSPGFVLRLPVWELGSIPGTASTATSHGFAKSMVLKGC